jgi:hypothetical protein
MEKATNFKAGEYYFEPVSQKVVVIDSIPKEDVVFMRYFDGSEYKNVRLKPQMKLYSLTKLEQLVLGVKIPKL